MVTRAIADATSRGGVAFLSDLPNGGWSPINTMAGNQAAATQNTPSTAYGNAAYALYGTTIQVTEISPVSVPAVRLVIANMCGSVAVSAPTAWGETGVMTDIEVRAAVVDLVNGYVYPVRFGSQLSTLIGPQGFVTSDPVEIPITAGVAYGVRVATRVTSPDAYIPFLTSQSANIGGVKIWPDAECSPNDDVLHPSEAGPAAWGTGMMHMMVLGYTGRRGKALLGLTDSIAQGLGDAGALLGQGAGWIAAIGRNRTALSDTKANLATPYCATTILSKQGETEANLSAPLSRMVRTAVAGYHTTVIDEGGINDFVAGTSLAAVKASALLTAKAFTAKGCKFIRATLTPQTSTTTGWTTAAGQTPLSTNTDRCAFNDWVRDASASGFIEQAVAAGCSRTLLGIWDPCALFEVNASNVLTTNGGRWREPTSAAVRTGTITTGGTVDATDTAAATTANTYRGGVMVMTSGSNSGKAIGIGGQSAAGVFSFNAGFSPALGIGDAYQIYLAGGPLTSDGTHWSSSAVLEAAAAFDKTQIA